MEAIREMVALRAQGKPLRTIADAVRAKIKISHEGVAGVLRAALVGRIDRAAMASKAAAVMDMWIRSVVAAAELIL
jgi:hypothetical protein